jgi:hypothetical protein
VGEWLRSPYDRDVRYGRQRPREWIGYQVHLTEGCEDDVPHLITQVATAPATHQDQQALDASQADLAAHDLLPAHQLVDAGDTSAKRILSRRDQHAVDRIGPVHTDPSWQARTPGAVAISQFSLDWGGQQVTCPGGAAQGLLAAGRRRQRRVHRPGGLRSGDVSGLCATPRLHRRPLHGTQPDAALSPSASRDAANRPPAPANRPLQDPLSPPRGQ